MLNVGRHSRKRTQRTQDREIPTAHSVIFVFFCGKKLLLNGHGFHENALDSQRAKGAKLDSLEQRSRKSKKAAGADRSAALNYEMKSQLTRRRRRRSASAPNPPSKVTLGSGMAVKLSTNALSEPFRARLQSPCHAGVLKNPSVLISQ